MSRGCCFLAAILSLLAVAADGAPAADLPRARLLREIYPGPMGAGVSFAGVLNGTLLFYAEDPEHGRELWRSDGTFAGTTLVRDLLPGPESGIGYGDSTMFGDLLAFPVSYSASGAQLWRSDGTEEGTVLVRNLAPGVANSSASLLTPAGERLWFTVQSDFWDQEKRGTEDLWSTDLTPQGTERLPK